MDKKEQTLVKIEKLQETRNYASPEERARLTKEIKRLLEELER